MKTLIIGSFLLVASLLSGAQTSMITATIPSNSQVETEINTVINDTKSKIEQIKTQIKDTKTAIENQEDERLIKFFDFKQRGSCNTPASLVCPELTSQFASEHVTMIDYINPIAGEISCSVYKKIDERGDLFNSFNKSMKMAPVHTEVFKFDVCKQEFSQLNNRNSSNDIENLRKKVKGREEELDQIRLSYEVDFKMNGGEKYLDLGDWLDALSTVDAEKIDIENTLKSGAIQTTSNYTVIPNSMISKGFADALQNIRFWRSELVSGERDELVRRYIEYNDRNQQIANSKYVMYLDYFTNANKYINEIINTLLLLFIGRHLLGSWLLRGTTEKFSSVKAPQDHVHRAIFGVGVLLIFYVGENNVITINNENGIQTEVEVKSQRVQSIVRSLYSFTNEISDSLAEIAISSYLKNLTQTSGMGTLEQVNNITSELLILEKENDLLIQIDNQFCENVYDQQKIKQNLEKYRKGISEKRELTVDNEKFTGQRDTTSFKNAFEQTMFEFSGNFYGLGNGGFVGKDHRKREQVIASLIINPYPYSEREAHVSSYLDSKNAYDDSGNGYVKSGFFRSSEFLNSNQWMGLSACSYNRKQVVLNNVEIKKIKEKIAVIGQGEEFDKKKEKIKNVAQIMWKNYAELGYISMSFLPALSFIIDDIEDLKSEKSIAENMNDDESILQEISKAIPMMALFNGWKIAEGIEKSLPNLSLLSEYGSIYGAYLVIDSILNVLPSLTLIISSIFAFIMLTLTKLWAFFSILFIVIYAFSENQEQKVLASIGKIIGIAFKTVLLTVTMFIAIWSLSLVDSLEYLLVSDFFDNIMTVAKDSPDSHYFEVASMSEFKAEFKAYAIYGTSHLAFTILKVVLLLAIVFKLPSFFYELIEAQTSDAGSKIDDYIQDKAQNQTLKGV